MAIKMRMPVRVTGVTLNKSSISLTTIGQTEQLTATITPANAEDTAVAWSSSDTTVATVSDTGLVTCVSLGTATITATTNDGGYTATCGVTDRQWWQPTANTLCYFPFTTNFDDESGHGYSLTAYNGAVIGTLNGLKCLDATATNSYLSGTVSGLPQGNQARTDMCWINWNAVGNYPVWHYGTSGQWGQEDSIWKNDPISWSNYGWGVGTGTNATPGQWIHIAITTSGTYATCYMNGQQMDYRSINQLNTQGTLLYVATNPDLTALDGYLSDFIIENKTWTAQEVLDYFNLTKGAYGIS